MLSVILAVFSVLIVVIDQVSKYFVLKCIPVGGLVPVWDGVFHLTHVQNSGMAFSMLEGARVFFVLMTIAAFILLYFAIKEKWVTHPVGLWALAMIAGGAVGNLIDRIRWGYVVDMIEVEFLPFNFAVFNVADCFVVVGAILLVIYAFFFDKGKDKEKSKGENQA